MVRRHTITDFDSASTLVADWPLCFVQQRMYDPTVGVFISADPIEADANNTYRYVGNSPTNGTDPSGLASPDNDNISPELKAIQEDIRAYPNSTFVGSLPPFGLPPAIECDATSMDAHRVAYEHASPSSKGFEHYDDPTAIPNIIRKYDPATKKQRYFDSTNAEEYLMQPNGILVSETTWTPKLKLYGNAQQWTDAC